MTRHVLRLSPDLHDRMWSHLLPTGSRVEQAAFLFCSCEVTATGLLLKAIDAQMLQPNDFAAQYNDYLELTDSTRVSLIKRAHGLGASLAEFHSHPTPWRAAFSPSDRQGLRETVPHMRWRLKGRPYLAVVVAPSGYDALIWTHETDGPQALAGIRIGDALLEPTNASLEGWGDE